MFVSQVEECIYYSLLKIYISHTEQNKQETTKRSSIDSQFYQAHQGPEDHIL